MATLNGHKIGAIKRAIDNHIHTDSGRSFIYSDCANWYVGITNNPSVRKTRHEYEKQLTALYFKSWEADTKANAREIEMHFHKLGMKEKDSEGGTKPNSTMVYVFKIKHNLLDVIGNILNSLLPS